MGLSAWLLQLNVPAKMPVKIYFRGLQRPDSRAMLNSQTVTLQQSGTARCSKLVCWVQAAWAAIQVYLELHQKPMNMNHGDDDLANSSLSPEELKKLKLKRKKVTCSLLPTIVRFTPMLQAHKKPWQFNRSFLG